MEVFSKLYTVFYGINILLALAIIFLERKNVSATWSWLMVLLFLPFVGFILYILLGQNLRRRKLYKLNQEGFQFVQGLITEQQRKLQQRTFVFHDPAAQQYQDIMEMYTNSTYSVITQDNEVEVFTSGQEKFDSLIASIGEAKDHIHLLYYIFRNDSLGREILKALVRKAEEGVKVRVLYDDIGSLPLTRRFFADLKKAGGDVAAFFPSKIPYLNVRLNYRNHRKLAIIDGKIGFIGGFNIGDEYLGLNRYLGHWRDTHLQLRGSAVHSLQSQFILDWNLASSRPVPFEANVARYFPAAESKGNVAMQIVASGPNSRWPHILNGYLQMIYAAKESIYLQTPYFIPDESLLNALKIAALSGVDVKIMLPFKSDNALAQWASSSYLGGLLESGVKCYYYVNGFLHAKTIVVDGKIASVGTANIDNRSMKLNFEINAFVYDTRTAGALQQIFLRDLEDCEEITKLRYANRSTALRLKESVSRLLSPIM
ncbi:cardiolipin synthase [Brevibacillus sp. B_LB10_24]|uniref:cardiolipin synthase n=1 Tax=Brevibacillus sp. B_LB10_24 TaxID=3380645 RepID=UPI0038B6DEB7